MRGDALSQRRKALVLVAFLAGLCVPCLAQNPNSDPYNFTPLGDIILFTARDELHGRELWAYDPVKDEVRLVADIWPGLADGIPLVDNTRFSVVGDVALFTAQSVSSIGVWRTDGTEEGTRHLISNQWSVEFTRPTYMTSPPGRVLFTMHETEQWTLYSSDGTHVDQLLPPIRDRYGASTYNETHVLIHGAGFIPPHLSDGTPEGTKPVEEFSHSEYRYLSLGPRIPTGIVSTVGPATTNRLYILNDDPLRLTLLTECRGNRQLVRLGSRCIFQTSDSRHGKELWVTDGTPDGTHLLMDIIPGPQGSDPYQMATVGDRVFFSAEDGIHGRELWVTDGTVAGTHLVKDVFDGPGDAEPYGMADLNGRLIFGIVDETFGEELWVSDGTAGGTYMLKDIWAGPESSEPYHFTRVDDVVYFSANDGVNGREMWRTDGTPEGTFLVADINAPERAIASGSPRSFVQAGDWVWFIADGRDGGVRLCRSDGTSDGTALMSAEVPLPDSIRLVWANETSAILTMTDEAQTTVLAEWRGGALTPLLPAGVTLLDDAPTAVSDGRVFFAAHDDEHGTELWVLYTSPAAVRLVCDIRPGPESSAPSHITAGHGRVYFGADDGQAGRELWVSDGTEEETMLAADIAEGRGSSNPQEITLWDGDVYVVADDGTHGPEVWKYDAAAGRGVLLADIYEANDGQSTAPSQLTVSGSNLFFTARTAAHGVELWRTDGTPEGTQLVRDITGGRASSWPRELTDLDGVLYFSAYTPGDGYEIWVSDGAAAGTYQVHDILGGKEGSAPSGLTRVGDQLIFVADAEIMLRGPRSREIWTLPKGRGPGLLADIWPGHTSSEPSEFTVIGTRALFRANDGVHGAELWCFDAETRETALLKDLLPQTIAMPRRK